RTRVQGFAGPCLCHSATPPLPAPSPGEKRCPGAVWTFGRVNGVRRLRADDGIRTRDPHLGKVMLYQLSHVRVPAPARAGKTAPAETDVRSRTLAHPGRRANLPRRRTASGRPHPPGRAHPIPARPAPWRTAV